MTKKRIPTPVPSIVKPIDSTGAPLSAGDLVRILEIPSRLIRDLPPDDVALILAELNAFRRISRFDAYGYAWFGDASGDWFCLLPENLRRVADA